MSGFRALLDTCVLVPIVKADLLLTLGRRGAFNPLWSDAILGELTRVIGMVNPSAAGERIAKRVAHMNAAFEDALVTGWRPLEVSVVGLPDPGDRHVVAAAVRGNAAAIVTDNIRDFPVEVLEPWGIHAVTSDDFLLDALDLDERRVVASLIEMVERRTNPPVALDDVLTAIGRAGAPSFAAAVREVLDG